MIRKWVFNKELGDLKKFIIIIDPFFVKLHLHRLGIHRK